MNTPLSPPNMVWLNGRFVPSDEARVSPLDRGFVYGDGFFETIRAENGSPLYLREHLDRLYASLSAFRITPAPIPDWAEILIGLLARNGLDRGTASIKVLITRGIVPALGLPASDQPTICVFANEYVPPGREDYESGWDVHIFKEGYSPPLASHKSLNYLYYLTARQAALDCGCREAVLLDREGRVAETSAGSILARTGGRWWTPLSPHLLPGITIRQASVILLETGIEVENRPVLSEDLFSAEMVWVLNSLIGIMPVSKIDGRAVADPGSALAARIRDELFTRG